MNRCSRCLIPDTRPDTAFIDGVCSACMTYSRRTTIDWGVRERDLRALLDKHDGKCIVPSSGGKDSTWQALTLAKMGADVTAVTAATCQLTKIGRKNIKNLEGHVRTIHLTPNRTTRAKLNRIALELVGDISWPEHISIHRAPFRVAVDKKIPLIFYGENPLNQYGSPPGLEDARQMTQRWVSEFGGFLGLRVSDVVGMEGITTRDMDDYLAPTDDELKKAGVAAYFLGQFLPWDSHTNAEFAKAHGFEIPTDPPSRANRWTFENLDNAQTGIHDYFGFLKYGYGRGCAQASVDIRSGRTTRAEALEWVRENDGAYPTVYAGVNINDVLALIGMSDERFHAIASQFMNKALFIEERIAGREQRLNLRNVA